VAAAIVSGCATHRPQTIAERFVHHDASAAGTVNAGGLDRTVPQSAEQDASLAVVMDKVRALVAAPRPPRANEAATLEGSNAELSAARVALVIAPNARNHRQVAEAYVRLGVLDAAYDHYTAAVRLARNDATSYDGRARIWRDWGFPHLGLTDAYRAIHYAPGSPVPQNTLGTLLLKMGQPADARTAFERALVLDPHAAYALNNLCLAALLQGDNSRAIEACRGAIREQPELISARNNLARAYAASEESGRSIDIERHQ
jgi:tetratricopeptide (TPR) repeat protein